MYVCQVSSSGVASKKLNGFEENVNYDSASVHVFSYLNVTCFYKSCI